MSRRLTPSFTRAMVAMVLASGLIAPSVLAQTVPSPPRLTVPAGSPINRLEPSSLPPVSPGGLNLAEPAAGEVPNIPIAVRRVEITGATLFGDALNRYLVGLTGPAVPLTRLDHARQEILHHYRSRGYALCTVSLHVDRATGTVVFQVTEGRIAAVRLDHDIGPAGTMVLRFLNHLTEERVIDTATLERYLLLAQDVPGVSLSTVLTPSKDVPGALELVAEVSLKHVSGQVSLDNRAYGLTGPWEFLGIADLNSFTAWGDRTEFAYFHSFPNSQNFGQISSDWFIGSDGLKIRLYAGEGVNDPTGPLAALNYRGFTDIFGTQLTYPLIRSRRQNLYVYGALDALESRITTTSANIQASADEIRVLRAGVDYSLSDLVFGPPRPATNQISVRLSQGLEILGGYHGTASPPSTARLNEQHNFTAVKFELSRTQTLFAPWQGATVALMGLVTGQWTDSVLPPAEQFYLGGSHFTRGFYSGQEQGDKALAVTAELQLNDLVDLTSLGGRSDTSTQFYIFYDWGETWQNQSSDFAARLASAGGGTRLQLTKYVELDLEALGRLTTRPPPATASLNGIGLFARVVGRF
jgi:hemolysin activation/secretion protein